MQAARGGHVQWKKEQMNVPDKEGFVPLHYAVLNENVGIIEELLAAKCGEFGIIIVLCHCIRNYLNSCTYL